MTPDHGNRKHLYKEVFNSPEDTSEYIDILVSNGIKNYTRFGTVLSYKCTTDVQKKIREDWKAR